MTCVQGSALPVGSLVVGSSAPEAGRRKVAALGPLPGLEGVWLAAEEPVKHVAFQGKRWMCIAKLFYLLCPYLQPSSLIDGLLSNRPLQRGKKALGLHTV